MTTNEGKRRVDFEPGTGTVFDLDRVGSWPETRHRFDRTSILAVQTALAAERPLLISGEPGVGKSQLARAVAQVSNVPFLYHVVSSRTEHTDLLYEYDAVSRLAQAQVLGRADAERDWKAELKEERFIRPGVLWWALDWEGARTQAKKSCRSTGCSTVKDCCPGCGEPAHPPEGDGDGQWHPGEDAWCWWTRSTRRIRTCPTDCWRVSGISVFRFPARSRPSHASRVIPLR
jgi:hypothetical protein